MKLVPNVLPEGRRDIIDICDYLDAHSDTAAIRFRHGLDETVDFLCQAPDAGERFPCDSTGQIRRRTVFNFRNYIIYYRRKDETIQIVRVVHGARDDSKLFDN